MSDQPGQPAADPTEGVNANVARQHEQAAREAAEAEAAAEAARKARQKLNLPDEEPAGSIMPGPSVEPNLNGDPQSPSQAAFDEERRQGRFNDASEPPVQSDKSWTPNQDDPSLKARLYRATIAGPSQRGLITTIDEDEQLANVDVSGANNEHVSVTFKDNMSVYMSHGYKQASGLHTPQQRERAASMMCDQAQREGWNKVWISGSDKQMCDELWVQAQLNGLKTGGHRPSKSAKAKLQYAQKRQPNPFEAMAGTFANEVQGAITRGHDAGDDMPPAAGGDDPGPDLPPSGPDSGNPKGSGGGGEAKYLPEAEAPKADAEDFQPPAKVGTAAFATGGAGALATAIEEPALATTTESARIQAPEVLKIGVDESQFNHQLDKFGRFMAQATLDGMIENETDPGVIGAHDHVFGEQTPETRAAFKEMFDKATPFKLDDSQVDGVADRVRTSAQEMIAEANGKGPVVHGLPANVVNLATAAPGMAAHSDAKGTDLATAKDIVARKPDIGDMAAEAKGAIVVFDPKKSAVATTSVTTPAATTPDALIAGAAERLSAKRGADAVQGFEKLVGKNLGGDEPGAKPQLPAIRRA